MGKLVMVVVDGFLLKSLAASASDTEISTPPEHQICLNGHEFPLPWSIPASVHGRPGNAIATVEHCDIPVAEIT